MNEFIELTDQQLEKVGGGFLGLLGLIGTGASLFGQIGGMIGKGKQQKAEKIVKDAESDAQAAGLGQGQPQRGAGNMMGEGAVASKPSG